MNKSIVYCYSCLLKYHIQLRREQGDVRLKWPDGIDFSASYYDYEWSIMREYFNDR